MILTHGINSLSHFRPLEVEFVINQGRSNAIAAYNAGLNRWDEILIPESYNTKRCSTTQLIDLSNKRVKLYINNNYRFAIFGSPTITCDANTPVQDSAWQFSYESDILYKWYAINLKKADNSDFTESDFNNAVNSFSILIANN